MRRNRQTRLHVPRLFAGLLLSCASALFCGCETAGYYTQAVGGHLQVVTRQKACQKLLKDPDTSAELKSKLELARQLCTFAESELSLPANGHYRRYADLERRFVVWNVYAAPEFSVEPKTWWYPFLGSLDYRGYFSGKDARKYADRLWAQGFDVYVEGVEAYSTLGWFKDPLLNTFIHHREAVLAETLFHELAHQRMFARGDTDFNEAFATAVGQEGVRRWLEAKNDQAALEEYETALSRERQFVILALEAHKELDSLYDDWARDGRKSPGMNESHEPTVSQMRAEKQRTLNDLWRRYQELRKSWQDYSGYDAWFEEEVNNARLNSLATYYDLVPAFEQLLAGSNGDLEAFYAEVKRLSKLPKEQRHQQLRSHQRPSSHAEVLTPSLNHSSPLW